MSEEKSSSLVTVIVVGLVVATLNPRHFEGLEGLAVEDWSR